MSFIRGSFNAAVVLYIVQAPSWYPPLSSRQVLSQETQEIDPGEGESQGIKRQLSSESSSPDSVCPPPRKKKRLTSSSSSKNVSVLYALYVHEYSNAQKERKRERRAKQHNTTQDLRQLFHRKGCTQVGLAPTPHA